MERVDALSPIEKQIIAAEHEICMLFSIPKAKRGNR